MKEPRRGVTRGTVLEFPERWTPEDLAALRAALPVRAEDGRILLTAEQVEAYRREMVYAKEIRWSFR